MKLIIAIAYHISVERLDNYVENLNSRLHLKTQNINFGGGIKTLSFSLTCFLRESSKVRSVFYQGKKIKRLRTFGLEEFEDYMGIYISLKIEEVIGLLEKGKDPDIYSYLETKIVESVKSLQLKYNSRTPDFNWNELFKKFPIMG